MNSTFIEKLAFHSGRRAAPSRSALCDTLVVLPENTPIYQTEYKNGPGKPAHVHFLSYMAAPSGFIKLIGRITAFILGFMRMAAACSRVEIFVLTNGADRTFGLVAAILGRLTGRRLILHDYRFFGFGQRDQKSLIRAICGEIRIGDPGGFEATNHHDRVSLRYESPDREPYRDCQKRRAIPHVIVYGDLQCPKAASLIVRVHELVKQKYPRSEFSCITFNRNDLNLFENHGSNHSLRCILAGDEADVQNIYNSGDILVILSRGGRNRYFLERALIAGFPIITNGIDISDFRRPGNISVVARDSYSAIANGIIALVDDENRYQSLSAN